jgi:foldase protein PrsA
MKRVIVLGALVCIGICISAPLMAAAPKASPASPGLLASPATKPAASAPVVKGPDGSPVLVYFGDKAITEAEIDKLIGRPTSGPAIPAEFLQAQRQRGLTQMLTGLLFESYGTEHPDAVSQAEVDALIKKYDGQVAQMGQKLEDVVRQRLGITMEEFRKRLVADAVMQKAADEKNVNEFYEKHKSDFDGTQYTAKHILLYADQFLCKPEQAEQAKDKLQEIKKEIQSGKLTFDEAVEKYSDDARPLQAFPRYGRMVEPFAAATAALKPGEVSDPVKSSFGYHLIQLVSRAPGQALSLEQAKAVIQRHLAGQAAEKLIAEERAKHPIKVLMDYVKPPRPPVPPHPATGPATRPTAQMRRPTSSAPVFRPVTPRNRPEPNAAPKGVPTAPPQP